MVNTLWTSASIQAPLPVRPQPGRVDLWRIHLEDQRGELPLCRSVLSPDEAEAADRYRFAEHGEAYALCRGFLRRVLGAYLQVEPREIRFVYGEHGKPDVADPSRHVHFNLSHSSGIAVIAVSADAVGVDVEKEREMRDLEDVARRFFTPREAAALSGQSPTDQRGLFFRCWTRKEAVIKAMGKSIAHLSADLDVLASTEPLLEPMAISSLAPDLPDELHLVDLPAPAGWQSACCLAARIREVRLNDLS